MILKTERPPTPNRYSGSVGRGDGEGESVDRAVYDEYQK